MVSETDSAWLGDGIQLYDVFKLGEDNALVKIAEIHDTSESYLTLTESGEMLISESNDLLDVIENLEGQGYQLLESELKQVVAATTEKGTLKAIFDGSEREGKVDLRLDGNNGLSQSLGTFQYGYLPTNNCLHLLNYPIFGKDREELAQNVGKHLVQQKEKVADQQSSQRTKKTKDPYKFKLRCRNLVSLIYQAKRFRSCSSYFCKSPKNTDGR